MGKKQQRHEAVLSVCFIAYNQNYFSMDVTYTISEKLTKVSVMIWNDIILSPAGGGLV